MDDSFAEKIVELSKSGTIFSSPTRLSIMMLLYLNTKMKFTTMQKILNLTPGNLSSHLRKLEKEGMVKIVKGFIQLKPATMIYITEKGAKDFRKFISNFKEILESIIKEEE
ncbi:MAG: transcriptional regulator [Candidatus Njordarchaeia archaeon]